MTRTLSAAKTKTTGTCEKAVTMLTKAQVSGLARRSSGFRVTAGNTSVSGQDRALTPAAFFIEVI